MWAVGAVESARSVSWPDGVKGDLKQALVSLCLVLHMLVVFSDCCLLCLLWMLSLGCSYIWFD